MKLKIVLHNLLKNKIFQKVIFFLSFFIFYINTSDDENRIYITIDTESGYLKKNNERVWMRDNPKAFEGYYFGIKNTLKVLRETNVKATFFVSTQCFSAPKQQLKLILSLLKKIVKDGHEIGIHVHPREDACLQQKMGIQLNYTSSRFYTKPVIDQIIKTSKDIFKENLGEEIASKIQSLRWGNFAGDARMISLLSRNKINIDSTIRPMTRGHFNNDRYFDWRHVINDFSFKTKSLTEIPFTMFWFFGYKHVDPVYGSLIKRVLRRKGDIVLMTHSSECTYKDGSVTYVLSNLVDFINYAKVNNAKFITISQVNNPKKV